MKRQSWIILVLLVLSPIVLFCYLTGDQEGSEPDIVITSTPTTSSLTWYTSIPQIQADRIANAFTIKTGIEVQPVRNSTFIMRDRLMAELEAGRPEADVLTLADIGTYDELVHQDRLMQYESPHYKDIPDQYKHPPYWAVFEGFGICMAYDESRLSDPPRNWTDLLDDRWKGRIGLEDIRTAGSQYGQYYLLREQLGVEFWNRLLSNQKPRIYMKTEDLANALLEGEIDVAGQFSIYTVYNYRIKKGTPIQGVYPDQGIPFVLTPTAILKQSNRPEEAKAFTDFLLSQSGQALMQRLIYKYSVRKDSSILEGKPALESLNILIPRSPLDYSRQREKYSEEFYRFLGVER